LTKKLTPSIKNLSLPVDSLSEVLNSVGAFIYTKDLQGRYTYANKAVLDLFDKTLEAVIGFDDSHFFDLTLSQQLSENDRQVMMNNIIVESEEANFLKELQEMRIYKTIKKPLHDDGGSVVGMCGISTDITEEKKLHKKLKSQKQLLDIVLDNVDAYIYMKDSERTFKYVNSKVADLFGNTVANIVGKKDTEVLPIEIAEHFNKSDQKVFDTHKKQVIEESFEDEHGQINHYISTKIPYRQESEVPALIGFSTNVTELYLLKEEFKKQANTDPLTELYNRRYFTEHAEREFHIAKKQAGRMSLISIDIDHFKKINDHYGHPVGDSVLIAVAKSLLSCVRENDILARIGGEEFSVLLPSTSLDQARVIGEKIRLNQRGLLITGQWQGEITITVSLGISHLNAEDQSFDALFSRADQALYQAKTLGRDQVFCAEK
jgi:diguanylate cyclase (GGDEF)-like protein/PAS domain S-box-containing protein